MALLHQAIDCFFEKLAGRQLKLDINIDMTGDDAMKARGTLQYSRDVRICEAECPPENRCFDELAGVDARPHGISAAASSRAETRSRDATNHEPAEICPQGMKTRAMTGTARQSKKGFPD